MVSESGRIFQKLGKFYSDQTHNNNNDDKSDTLSCCQISGKIQEGIYSDQTQQQQQQ